MQQVQEILLLWFRPPGEPLSSPYPPSRHPAADPGAILQKTHWKAGHKHECGKPTKVLYFQDKETVWAAETGHCSRCQKNFPEGSTVHRIKFNNMHEFFHLRFCSRKCSEEGLGMCRFLENPSFDTTCSTETAKNHLPSDTICRISLAIARDFPELASRGMIGFLNTIFNKKETAELERLRLLCFSEDLISAELLP